jgi:hypothetical protein
MAAPTWAQVYKLAHAQLATWAKGRLGENVNEYTIWYYGDHTSAAFCFIGISWTLAHAARTQAEGLALIGGKKAYVPNIRSIPGYRAGHSGVKVGAIAAVSSFNHIGFVVRVGSTTFDLLSFNSVSGSSDDAVTVKTYSLSAISGHVNLKYGSTSEADDMQPSDQLKIGDWMVKHWSKDKTITDGKVAVNTAIGSGYGHARAAHENTDAILTQLAAQAKVIETLAEAVKASAPDVEALKQTIKDELSKVDIRLAVSDTTEDASA